MVEGWTRELKLQFIFRSVEACSNINSEVVSVMASLEGKNQHSFGLPAIKEILIAEISKKWGCRRQTSQELLNELVVREDIVIDNQDVWTYERFEKIKEALELDYLKGANAVQKTFANS